MKTWDVTGLYRSSSDRMPAKRSRKIRGSLPAARLVIPEPKDLCNVCGFHVDSVAHQQFCGNSPARK